MLNCHLLFCSHWCAFHSLLSTGRRPPVSKIFELSYVLNHAVMLHSISLTTIIITITIILIILIIIIINSRVLIISRLVAGIVWQLVFICVLAVVLSA